MTDVFAFPLCWPEGWPRTDQRRPSRFKDRSAYLSTIGLRDELERLGATDVVVSTSVPLRRDGIPTAQRPVDGDPGAAVYWQLGDAKQCMACDIYNDVADNLHAIALCIEALRTLERHGGGQILDRAFMGFTALPGPQATDWHDVLKVPPDATLAQAEAAYRALAKSAHPDHGGSDEAMARLNDAIAAARKEVAS